MRLIDADALRDSIIRHRPSALPNTDFGNGMKEAVDYIVSELNAAPAVACAACEFWDVEYAETVAHGVAYSICDNTLANRNHRDRVRPNYWECPYFQRRQS